MICETLARRHVASWRRARLHRTIRITKKGGSTRMTDASGTGVRTGRHAEQRIRCTRDREGVRLQTRRRFKNKKYYMRAHIREPDAKPHMPARGAKANTHTMTCTQFRDTRRYAHHTLHRTAPGGAVREDQYAMPAFGACDALARRTAHHYTSAFGIRQGA